MAAADTVNDVALLITGMLSRFVNALDDDELASLTRDAPLLATVRAVRSNLRLALHSSVITNQTDLIGSYLQLLAMAEGRTWLESTIDGTAAAMRSPIGQPVTVAMRLVRQKIASELVTDARVAAAEDFLGNFTGDVILIATWRIIAGLTGGAPAPLWLFGRDDRLLRFFIDSVSDAERSKSWTSVPQHVRRASSTSIETYVPVD